MDISKYVRMNFIKKPLSSLSYTPASMKFDCAAFEIKSVFVSIYDELFADNGMNTVNDKFPFLFVNYNPCISQYSQMMRNL
jgi:hypothetical protein